MKKLLFLVAVVFLGLSACDNTGEGMLKISFDTKFQNQPLEMNKYYLIDGDSFEFTLFQFYLSDLEINDLDLNTVQLKDVDLIKATGVPTEFNVSLEEGTYRNLFFGLGLNAEQNGSDPSQYAADHPMSLNKSTYWMMSGSYIFLKLEGRYVKNGQTTPVVYHVGSDPYYRLKSDQTKSFTIHDEGVTEIPIQIDVHEIFSNLVLPQDSDTHTMNNPALATKVMDNFAGAVTIP